MTTLIVVYVLAAVVVIGIHAGIPMRMIHRHPDTAPHHKLPEYLRADWEYLPAQIPAGAGQGTGR